jgi:hypothetical protein
MAISPTAVEAMKKIVAALMECRYQAVAIGDAAYAAWGCARDVQGVDLLSSTGEKQRLAILAAGKKQGLLPAEAPPGLLRMMHKTAAVRILEASHPLHKLILARAEPGVVLGVRSFLATAEDLILLRTGSDAPADRAGVLELLKLRAGKLDADYLKTQAEALGTFDKLRAAWKTVQG